MRTALLQLAEDFLTAIVFVIVYLATNHLVAAVGIGNIRHQVLSEMSVINRLSDISDKRQNDPERTVIGCLCREVGMRRAPRKAN
jgi:hypothetical protein